MTQPLPGRGHALHLLTQMLRIRRFEERAAQLYIWSTPLVSMTTWRDAQGEAFETDAPGAAEIHALDYLRFIVADESIDAEDRAFLLQGAGWLEDMAQQMTGTSFTALDEDGRERVLRRIEGSSAGHNWLSQMLLYLIEALLSDPAYGGNAQRAGWRWLAHIPGFPSPPPDKLYPELLKR